MSQPLEGPASLQSPSPPSLPPAPLSVPSPSLASRRLALTSSPLWFFPSVSRPGETHADPRLTGTLGADAARDAEASFRSTVFFSKFSLWHHLEFKAQLERNRGGVRATLRAKRTERPRATRAAAECRQKKAPCARARARQATWSWRLGRAIARPPARCVSALKRAGIAIRPEVSRIGARLGPRAAIDFSARRAGDDDDQAPRSQGSRVPAVPRQRLRAARDLRLLFFFFLFGFTDHSVEPTGKSEFPFSPRCAVSAAHPFFFFFCSAPQEKQRREAEAAAAGVAPRLAPGELRLQKGALFFRRVLDARRERLPRSRRAAALFFALPLSSSHRRAVPLLASSRSLFLVSFCVVDLSELDLPAGAVVTFPDGSESPARLHLVLCPSDGPYADGSFLFEVRVPSGYPHEPPKVRCLTRVYHPNIDPQGNVCLNILREDWSPVLSLTSIFLGLSVLLDSPNADDPLNAQAAEHMRRDPMGFAYLVGRAVRTGATIGGEYYARAQGTVTVPNA